jgi:basic amino acid/polyamine antiporter, APA family
MPTEESFPKVSLTRRLGLFDATMIIIGDVIGIGIFTTSGLVAEAVNSPAALLAGWLIGGLLTLCGALTYAELGGMLPHAGGEYVYLRQAYGSFLGFLNGWTYFTVTNPGSIAAMSVGLIAYLAPLVPAVRFQELLFQSNFAGTTVEISNGQFTAIGVIAVFSWINYVGLRAGSFVQNVLTILKLGAVTIAPLLGLLIGTGSWSHFSVSAELSPPDDPFRSLSVVMVSIFFSYTGWFTSTYIASEIREPHRNVPYSIILATLVVTAAYLLVNVAFLYALPIERMRGVANTGEVAAMALFGPKASTYMTLAILISILGAANAVILTAPRIYYAMARDGLFFKAVARVHPRFKTPAQSILIQAIWSCILVLSGTFSQLLTYTVVPMLAFSIMTGVSIFVLRRTQPDLKRPYKTFGYPWVPVIFVSFYVFALLQVVIASPRESLLGLGIVVLGIPLYWFWSRRTTPAAQA